MFIVKTFVTKPAGKTWYRHDPALGAQTISQWVATKNSIMKNRTRKKGKNKKVNTMVFADQAAYEAFRAELEATALHQAKMSYFADNNFVVVTKKFQTVE